MSKDTGKKSKSRKRKSQKKSNGRFEVLADYRAGEKFPDAPVQFASDFRLLRQMVRWAKRYGVLKEGRLHIYVSRTDMEKNQVWRTVDLARSVVSYRNFDRKLIVNTADPFAEIFRLKVDEQGKYKQWVDQLQLHRRFGQAKLAPMPKACVIAVPVRAPPPPSPGPEVKSEEALGVITAMDNVLNKLEANLSADPSQMQDIHTAQVEYLNMAREAQTKFRALFGLPDQHHIRKWQPTAKPTKTQIPPTSAPPNPSVQQSSPERAKPVAPTASIPTKAAPKLAASEKKPAPTQPPKTETHTQVPTPGSSSPTSVGTSTPITRESAQSVRVTPTSSDQEDVISVEEQKIDDIPDVDGPDGDRSGSEKEEAPSPTKVPVYRQKLPAVMGAAPSVYRIAMAAIGRDVMQFSLPASIMEPLSMLQVICEELEYSELIDQAVSTPEPHLRMAYVACFACSRYGSTAYRTGRKPFNPLLSQTFEFDSPHLGWRFVGEQVQHHPSVSAGCAEGRGWQWWQDCEMLATYGGNSMEIKPAGVVYLYLEKWKETYKWSKVMTCVSGLLSGSYFIDHYGDIQVHCSKTNLVAKVHFKKATRDRKGEIDGKVMNEAEDVLETIYGNWTDSMYIGPANDPNSAHCVWRLAALPPDHQKYYGYTRFAMALNEYRPDIHGVLPKTDSRYRPDQKALEMGRPDEADKIKKDIEDKQRKRRKEMESGKRPVWKPLWFQPTTNKGPSRGARWQFNGKYWKAKENEFKGITFLPLW